MSIKSNRKAYYDYEIVDTFEAGVELFGWEVKSIRSGNVNLNGNYVVIRKGELWLRGVNIGNWPKAPTQSEEIRLRERRLLLHKSQISKLSSEIQASKRYTLVVLDVYENNSRIKMKLGLVKGKRLYEKKDKIKQRDLTRDISRELKNI
jgi:SsrA-binding protein